MINKGLFSRKVISVAQEYSIHYRTRSDHQEDLFVFEILEYFEKKIFCVWNWRKNVKWAVLP